MLPALIGCFSVSGDIDIYKSRPGKVFTAQNSFCCQSSGIFVFCGIPVIPCISVEFGKSRNFSVELLFYILKVRIFLQIGIEIMERIVLSKSHALSVWTDIRLRPDKIQITMNIPI